VRRLHGWFLTKKVDYLSEGNIVPSGRILEVMLEYSMYRKMQVIDVDEVAVDTKTRKNPFEILNECVDYMQDLFVAIEKKDKTVEYRVQQLAKGLVTILKYYPDACLGAIHLCQHGTNTCWQPLSVAMICELVAKRLNFNEEDRFAVLANTITSNIAMNKLQETLQEQTDPLSADQKKYLKAHPARSAEMLMETGIPNVGWIKTVFQHHERIDGSGYPEGISGAEIGVVVSRGKDKTVPLVSTFINSSGYVKNTPRLRNCLVTNYQIKDKFILDGELPFSYLELWNARYAKNEEISAA